MTSKNPIVPAKLTDRQRQFLDLWAEHDFAEEFRKQAFQAVYSEKNNGYSNRQLSKSPAMRQIIQKIMAKNGLTLNKLIKKHAALLDCEKAVVANGEVTMVPDNGTQLRAVQEGYKLGGFYPAEKHQIDVNKEETLKITLEDQRRAEKTLQECIDAEVVEDEGRGSDTQTPGTTPDSPLY